MSVYIGMNMKVVKSLGKYHNSSTSLGKIYKIKKTDLDLFFYDKHSAFYKDEIKIVIDSIFLKKFKEKKIAIECETKEQATEFCEWGCANGFRWRYEETLTGYKDKTRYHIIADGIFYNFFDFCNTNDYTIIQYKDLIQEDKKSCITKEQFKVIKPFTILDIRKEGFNGDIWQLIQECQDKELGFSFKWSTCEHCEAFPTIVKHKDWFVSKGFITDDIKIKPGMRLTSKDWDVVVIKTVYGEKNDCSLLILGEDQDFPFYVLDFKIETPYTFPQGITLKELNLLCTHVDDDFKVVEC